MCLKTEEEWAVDITNVSLVATAIAARSVSLLLYMYPNRLKLKSMGSGVRSEQKAGGTRQKVTVLALKESLNFICKTTNTSMTSKCLRFGSTSRLATGVN